MFQKFHFFSSITLTSFPSTTNTSHHTSPHHITSHEHYRRSHVHAECLQEDTTHHAHHIIPHHTPSMFSSASTNVNNVVRTRSLMRGEESMEKMRGMISVFSVKRRVARGLCWEKEKKRERREEGRYTTPSTTQRKNVSVSLRSSLLSPPSPLLLSHLPLTSLLLWSVKFSLIFPFTI